MKTINRMMINICSDKMQESKNFYMKLFDFHPDYDSDWFIHLASKDKQFELGIIDRKNEIVPKEIQDQPNGLYLTIIVDKVDDVYEIARLEDYPIVEEPKDTFYGQRRLLLKDPDGTIVDVSSPIPNFKF